jgi:RNA 3'-terminal phosphate cyclase (ATP)
MLPLALLAGGAYRTAAPSLHARTNADVVNLFLPGAVRLDERARDDWIVSVSARS